MSSAWKSDAPPWIATRNSCAKQQAREQLKSKVCNQHRIFNKREANFGGTEIESEARWARAKVATDVDVRGYTHECKSIAVGLRFALRHIVFAGSIYAYGTRKNENARNLATCLYFYLW